MQVNHSESDIQWQDCLRHRPHLQLLCPNSQASMRVSLLQQRSHSEQSGLPAMLLHQHMRSQLQLQSPQWLASAASVKVHLRGVGFLIGLTAYSLMILAFCLPNPWQPSASPLCHPETLKSCQAVALLVAYRQLLRPTLPPSKHGLAHSHHTSSRYSTPTDTRLSPVAIRKHCHMRTGRHWTTPRPVRSSQPSCRNQSC